MSTEFSFISLTKNDANYLDQLESMFYEYYKSMEDKGLIIKIMADGGKLWRKSIENGLGRTQNVVVVLADEKLVGFTWGYITLSPSYLGNSIMGVWNAIYVVPEYRPLGLSIQMYRDLEQWFIGKKVHSIESYSLMDNIRSIKFMKSLGFQEELIQLRKLST